ncbi:DUF1983 domain-containing protein [Pseudomonas sp. MWU13-3659]|uniref:phage tail protein n=1 Tax=Pseudomonas sp. MWU13-3659 TaxID=2986964 RepID=UPI00207590B7|nr:DUF1983 domain-containing protein [Pseudomonas sp. MWU13-3659]
MGETNRPVITGRKGGQKQPKAPVEAPDSLRSVAIAKMLIAVGEGEFAGTPSAQDIYLDGTPLMDANGSYNFPGVKWEWRPGSLEQPHIPGIPSVDNEITQGVELRNDKPWVRALDDTRLSAVRLRFAWPALQAMDSNGNVNGYRIEYAVDVATDGGAYVEVLKDAVHGKSTSTYERTRRIDLPKAEHGWSLRVRRLTPNQSTGKIADTMQIAGITEVIDAKLRYPNTALLYIEFSAEQFRNIPAVTVECKGRKWPVPSNYDPETRRYVGVWDGTFKQAWTDNPAWVTYGITTNDRFGLGRRIKPWMVDKWELYRIAQYCDQLVPDGRGGQEPRFTCNLNLQGKAEAWSLLRDIAGIYRGMTYWAQGQLYSLADMPRATDFDFAYTRANVVDGKFIYSSGSERSRYSRVLVSYDNPLNNYDTDVTVVADDKLLRRYGDNPLELSAIGCTRESEAQRRGKWALLTNSRDRGISFRVGMDGRIPLPGYVIPVADELLAGRPVGGRLVTGFARQVTLDRDTQAKPGDRLILNLPNGTCEGRTIESVVGRRITLTTAYSRKPRAELVWALDAPELAIPLYRVTSVSRPEPGIYEINAVQYDPSKFDHIDTGARLEERPISVTPMNLVPPPASVSLSSSHAISQGLAVSTLTIAWPAVSGAVAYEVEWRKDDGNWISLPRTGATSVDVVGIYAGAYLARVRSISVSEITSIWRLSMLTALKGKEGAPPALAFLRPSSEIFAIRLAWGFPEGAEDTAYTQIEMASESTGQNPIALGRFAYPTSTYLHSGMAAAVVRYFRARLVDRTGNVGPWSGWEYGQSSADASAVLEYLDGKIGESHLGKQLLSEIGKVSGDGPGSVNERFKAADAALQGQLNTLSTQLTDLAGAPDWKADTVYLAGSLVKHEGQLYRAKSDVPVGTPVANATYWENRGAYVSLGDQVKALAVRVDGVQTSVEEINGELTSMASRVLGVESAVSPSMAGTTGGWRAGETGSHAGAWSVYAALSEGDRAIARQVTEVKAQVDGNLAQVTRTLDTLTDNVSALARDNQTLTARVGETKAMVEDTSEAVVKLDGDVRASRSIKVGVDANGRYYSAGMAIGVENTPDGMQSQVLFLADRFAVMHQPGGAPKSVFAVNNGQVFMNNAIIGAASIGNAQITDASITQAKIADLSVTTGKIADLSVNTGKITDLSVSTLKIAGRSVTLPYSAYTAAQINSPPNHGSPNWVEVQALGFTSNGWEKLCTFSAQVGMMSTGWCFWRVLLNGAVWLQGRCSSAGRDSAMSPNSSFNTTALLTGYGGYNELRLQFSAPNGSQMTGLSMSCDNRSITVLEVQR